VKYLVMLGLQQRLPHSPFLLGVALEANTMAFARQWSRKAVQWGRIA